MGTEASAFELACVPCQLALTVDLADGDWREQLVAFGNAHRLHEQLIVQIPDQRGAADAQLERPTP